MINLLPRIIFMLTWAAGLFLLDLNPSRVLLFAVAMELLWGKNTQQSSFLQTVTDFSIRYLPLFLLWRYFRLDIDWQFALPLVLASIFALFISKTQRWREAGRWIAVLCFAPILLANVLGLFDKAGWRDVERVSPWHWVALDSAVAIPVTSEMAPEDDLPQWQRPAMNRPPFLGVSPRRSQAFLLAGIALLLGWRRKPSTPVVLLRFAPILLAMQLIEMPSSWKVHYQSQEQCWDMSYEVGSAPTANKLNSSQLLSDKPDATDWLVLRGTQPARFIGSKDAGWAEQELRWWASGEMGENVVASWGISKSGFLYRLPWQVLDGNAR